MTVMVDSSGNGNNGIYDTSGVGDITYQVTGIVPGDFAVQDALGASPAILGRVELASPFDPSLGFTIIAWEDVPTGALDNLNAVFSGTGSTANLLWDVRFTSGGDVEMQIVPASGPGLGAITGPGAPGAHMLAVTYSPDDLTIRFYVDGALIGSPQDATDVVFGTDITTIDIGDGVDGTYVWDEVSFGNVVMSAGDIASAYSDGLSDISAYEAAILATSPTGYYHLNDRPTTGWYLGRIGMGG